MRAVLCFAILISATAAAWADEDEAATEAPGNSINVRYARAAADVAHAEYQKALLANQKVPGVIPDVEIQRLKVTAERADAARERYEQHGDAPAANTKPTAQER